MYLSDLVDAARIILKYEPNATIEAAHDQIFVGSVETLEKMTQEERDILDEYNFFEEYESISKFV